jgi:hypothetical protein
MPQYLQEEDHVKFQRRLKVQIHKRSLSVNFEKIPMIWLALSRGEISKFLHDRLVECNVGNTTFRKLVRS